MSDKFVRTRKVGRVYFTFLQNLAVLISIKAAATAFIYDFVLLKVTRAEPIGYLNLSVSIPGNRKLEILFKI